MQADQPEALSIKVNPHWRVGIVYSVFYKEEVDLLISGAEEVLTEAGIASDNILSYSVPGSFEIPLIGSALAKDQAVDALIGLGILVQGKTKHANLIGTEVARAMMDIQLQHHIPFALEVLYVDTPEQAQERSRRPWNKGKEAAHSVLHTLAQLDAIASQNS